MSTLLLNPSRDGIAPLPRAAVPGLDISMEKFSVKKFCIKKISLIPSLNLSCLEAVPSCPVSFRCSFQSHPSSSPSPFLVHHILQKGCSATALPPVCHRPSLATSLWPCWTQTWLRAPPLGLIQEAGTPQLPSHLASVLLHPSQVAQSEEGNRMSFSCL